jgi:uncharacterized membrane protein
MKLSSSFTRDVVCVVYRLHTPDTMSCASALERDAGVEGAAADDVVAAGAVVRCFGAMFAGEEEMDGWMDGRASKSTKAIGVRVMCVGIVCLAGVWC